LTPTVPLARLAVEIASVDAETELMKMDKVLVVELELVS
jgi:hypothetical protein